MAGYAGKNAWRLYSHCLEKVSSHHPEELRRAIAWLTAENDIKIWDIVIKWFGYMQANEADQHLPDPAWTPKNHRQMTDSDPEDLIREIEEDFRIESGRFPEERGPGFDRLSPLARLAFAQEIWDVVKSETVINNEAEERVKKGESFPPQKEVPAYPADYPVW